MTSPTGSGTALCSCSTCTTPSTRQGGPVTVGWSDRTVIVHLDIQQGMSSLTSSPSLYPVQYLKQDTLIDGVLNNMHSVLNLFTHSINSCHGASTVLGNGGTEMNRCRSSRSSKSYGEKRQENEQSQCKVTTSNRNTPKVFGGSKGESQKGYLTVTCTTEAHK